MYVFLIDAWEERCILGGRRKLEVKPWATVREVKGGIAKLLRIPPQRQKLWAPAWILGRARERRSGGKKFQVRTFFGKTSATDRTTRERTAAVCRVRVGERLGAMWRCLCRLKVPSVL